VVAWSSDSGTRVVERRFDAGGSPVGGDFTVYQTSFRATAPRVASSGGGNVAISWMNWWSNPIPNSNVSGQLFTAQGAPLGAQFFVTHPLYAWSPAISWHPAGGFVVVWETGYTTNADVWGQRFDAAGTTVGAQFRVNTYTTDNQRQPDIAVTPDGQYVVVWQSRTQDGDGQGVYGQRLDAAGAALGAEFRVNDVILSDQAAPAVAPTAQGGFVVVWQSAGLDGSGTAIRGKRFARDGTPLGAEFAVNTYTLSDQDAPAVAADWAGNFVVSWTSLGQDGAARGIFAQRFLSDGQRRGAEFRVNTYTTDEQMQSDVVVDPVGNTSIVWSSNGQDGSFGGVFAQRYGGLYAVSLQVDRSGNRVLEPGETADVVPGWYNLNGAAQTFGGSLISFGGPAGATYTVTDASASYGTVANGSVGTCVDCYSVAVSNPPTRPATHWDALAMESIVPDAHGQQNGWPLHIGASFTDVPPSSPFYRFVETLLHRGVTAGCTGTSYCPASSTTREQMAVFVLVAKEGAGYVPPACVTPVFTDVPASSPFCRWVEELARRGVVSGCGGGNYCPAAAVSREQMAVFVLRTLDPTLTPPACGTPVFADVPAGSSFCPWIEELARRGVVSGCGGGKYCPAAAVSREQMGVFLGVTFGLTLYP
jgi:hypothetical protein